MKVPSPLPSRMLTVLSFALEAAISAVPFPSKSATATKNGKEPTGIGEPLASVKVPSPLPSRTLIVLSLALATARSCMPSPLKSPIFTASGKLPTVIGEPLAGENVPSPWPSSTITVLSPPLVATRSALPSWLKSPTVRAQFEASVGKNTRRGAHLKNFVALGKGAVSLAQENRDRIFLQSS